MKKLLHLCAAIIAIAATTACKSGTTSVDDSIITDTDGNPIIFLEEDTTDYSRGGIEHDWQLPLLGEWDVVRMDRDIISGGYKYRQTFLPELIMRFDDDNFYYETVIADGDTDTYQYGYVLRDDSLMLREDTEHWNPWHVIEYLSDEKLVLSNVDPLNGDTIRTTLTLKRHRNTPAPPDTHTH